MGVYMSVLHKHVSRPWREFIACLLTQFINTYLHSSQVLKNMKTTRVVPCYKKQRLAYADMFPCYFTSN